MGFKQTMDLLTRHLPNTTLIQRGGDEQIIFLLRTIVWSQFLARIVVTVVDALATVNGLLK